VDAASSTALSKNTNAKLVFFFSPQLLLVARASVPTGERQHSELGRLV